MSFPTEPSFVIHAKGWDENLLQHPLMKFLWEHEQAFDAKKFDECVARGFYAADVGYIRPNGTFLKGKDALQGLIQDFSLFKDYFRK